MKKWNRRKKAVIMIVAMSLVLFFILVYGLLIPKEAYEINMEEVSAAPSWKHLFGTDWLGRDMLTRTLKGMSTSVCIGVVTSSASCVIAVILGMVAAYFGKWADEIIGWLIDVDMGMPHMIFLILISVLAGRGMKGIIIGVVVTHWVGLARVIRVEVQQVKEQQYIKSARGFGKSRWYIMWKHIVPHILPQFFVGVVLLFPHAILHEAAITFLGFGLPPDKPAIGVILSEAMNYLNSGMWWLAVCPGVVLIVMVRMFDRIGEQIRLLITPGRAQE